ncbi:neutral ceramidase-like [Hyposmocoma kahamanoa]|uniref:neutral ceramidase-like n=1 Tax=Hyposmocoma kahamanoa TaxID=1477025 RepID=UPI000E6D8814|nr:neutral ceramidase-like [Hyposmocoma kahamanoa]
MAISLTGKIVITITVLAVIGGLTATIILLVNDSDDDDTTTEGPTTESTTTSDPVTDLPEDMLYEVGVGIADMTGPCVEINFMGYADFGQSGAGIHLRQHSRAFIFKKGDTRIVLVTADVQAVGFSVRRQVVQNLQARYGNIYTIRNVILTGTHTHSAPGGHLVDFLLDISILGFSRETYNAYVEGITRSIINAHENIVPARLFYGETQVKNAHMNRSPFSYDNNPETERLRYLGNTDDTLQQVSIVKSDGSLHGVLNWFAVHTTSMNMTNHLISSDNLGYASIRLEKTLNPNRPTGHPEIVAGFFSANLGDVSPNIRGARCEFSGDECDNQFKICDAFERCFALGPGDDMFESTRIIGTAVYEGALEVLSSPGQELTGELAVVHQFVEFSEETVAKYDTITKTFNTSDPVNGCVAAMGYSFASGTIDGANTLNITQGTVTGNDLLDYITAIAMNATEEDRECHAPKPILLATGRGNFPIPWHPRIVSVSLIWLGDFVIAGVPGEPTTMAGRRMKDVIGSVMERNGFEPRVAISGLTNEYIHYVATFEEYQIQRYEAASTIYGPYTLDIFLNKFNEFTQVAIEGGDVPAGPEPEDNRGRAISVVLPVIVDSSPLGRSFGDVLSQPAEVVRRGDTVRATFVAANPRNDLKQESTHAAIERFELGNWEVIATDADWETKFIWQRQSLLLATSNVIIEWTVPSDAIITQYRIVYYGVARSLLGNLSEFSGTSNSFRVTDGINI